MKPKAVQNITRRPVFFRLVLWVCCIGLLGWSAAPAWAQCNYVRADSYLAFATANDYVSPSTGDYLGGYGPGDDKDGDGLTNRQEWDGWSTDVNGVLTYFGWRTAATAPAGAVLEPGGCLEDVDSDCDGMSDYVERSALTNPQNGDTDGDGMGDAWEVYVGLDPRDDGTVNPDNAPGADPDGDGLTSAEEMLGPGCIYSGLSCATKENPFTQPAFGEDDFTYPLHYDSDGDKLIDSYEYQSGHGLDPVVADDSGADPDADGLTSFREQCVHPLLANFWGANSFASGE
ncbi:MAG: hypothetical protein KKC51_03085, partial [Verrucomicrobia bacterium]|nr:hypothetical protein [Verrucomicrobiota bacterium]